MNYYNSKQDFHSDNLDYYFEVHKYCEIIDITYDIDEICIHYTYDGNYGTYDLDMKTIHIIVIDQGRDNWYIPDHFEYLNKIEVIESNINVVSNGSSFTIENDTIKKIYLAFVDNSKEVDEIRDEKIYKLLDDDRD